MLHGCEPGEMPAPNSLTTPDVVMRPIRLPLVSVNHKLLSGPSVMLRGPEFGEIPALYSVTAPAVVILPMRLH